MFDYGKLITFFHFNVKHLGYDCEKSPDFWSAKVTCEQLATLDRLVAGYCFPECQK